MSGRLRCAMSSDADQRDRARPAGYAGDCGECGAAMGRPEDYKRLGLALVGSAGMCNACTCRQRRQQRPEPPVDTRRATAPWMPLAVCNQVDPALFYPERSQLVKAQVTAAKRVCSGCEFRAQCLAYALRYSEDEGIWGGLTPAERARGAT